MVQCKGNNNRKRGSGKGENIFKSKKDRIYDPTLSPFSSHLHSNIRNKSQWEPSSPFNEKKKIPFLSRPDQFHMGRNILVDPACDIVGCLKGFITLEFFRFSPEAQRTLESISSAGKTDAHPDMKMPSL